MIFILFDTDISMTSHWNNALMLGFNPLSPQHALKHRFKSLYTDLIFQQLRVL